MLKIWKTLKREIKFQNKFWTYYLDKFTIDNQKEFEYHFIHTDGSSLIIPILEDDKFILVKQYRYLNEKFSLEFPCGSVSKGLDDLVNAKKELEEETGYTSDYISELGFFNPYNGVTDEICKVFVAKNLIPKKVTHDETEQFEVFYLSSAEINQLISSNEIWDGMTLAAWQVYNINNKKL